MGALEEKPKPACACAGLGAMDANGPVEAIRLARSSHFLMLKFPEGVPVVDGWPNLLQENHVEMNSTFPGRYGNGFPLPWRLSENGEMRNRIDGTARIVGMMKSPLVIVSSTSRGMMKRCSLELAG
jgi:hypothetical protein